MLGGLLVSTLCQADAYQLGQGVRAGDFLFSGYGNFVAEAPHGQTGRLVVDDLSLYVNGAVNRWLNPFLETEVTGADLLREGGGNASGRLVLERFYDDVHLSSTNTLRIGKILSPVGDWNLIHAAPLVPTITRPLTTFRGFAEYTSGLSWLHESAYAGASPDWQIYWQPAGELLRRPDSVSPRHHRNVFGAHLNWNFGMLDNVGVSYQQGEQLGTGQRYTLGGLNARKVLGRLTLQGESTAAYWSDEPAGGHRHEWGAFLVADYRFTQHWHGIVEREVFQPHGAAAQSRSNLLGVAYKPDPAIVWKLEYVHQEDLSPEIRSGWSASCAVLF